VRKTSLIPRVSSPFIVVSIFIAVMAANWDIWWHGAIGRDSFWEPPHLFLYAAVSCAILGGLFAWYRTRVKAWRRVVCALALIPLSAPFDDLWHRIFGVEDLSSIWVIWSPPHVLLALGLASSSALLIPIILELKGEARKLLFASIALSCVMTGLLFLTTPLQPLGPHKLVGFWGAGSVAFIFAAALLFAQHKLPGIAQASLVSVFATLIYATSFGEDIAPGIVIQPHDHPPAFLSIFSYLLPALAIDLLRRSPSWLRGGLVGLVWSSLTYGFSSQFFEPQFQYGLQEGLIAVVSAVGGGTVAGLLVSSFSRRPS